MYRIIEKLDGTFLCVVSIQDGIERGIQSTKQKAIFEVIKSARVLNGTYITEADIIFQKERLPQPRIVSEEDWELLSDIKRGEKILLNFNDLRVKMRITEQDCQIIQQLREGDLTIVATKDTSDV